MGGAISASPSGQNSGFNRGFSKTEVWESYYCNGESVFNSYKAETVDRFKEEYSQLILDGWLRI
jgi:hypothetical protein